LHLYTQTGYNLFVARFLFDWDEANIEHIGRHRFAPDDVEEVFAEGCAIRRARDGRHLAYGRTFDGRMTVVVFLRLRGRHIRVITAREMTENERRRYRRD
jgi:uncharacterized DUF497 family protein